MIFRRLEPHEIECRLGSVWDGGFSLLLYKTSRVDMQLLDETVGPENWQRDHKDIKGTVYCGVGIRDSQEHNVWIWKWDAGAETYTEKAKGEASDSFKRACVNWGIGRELYTAPFIALSASTYQDGKRYRLSNKKDGYGYYVSHIAYDDMGNITDLIIDKEGIGLVFAWEREKRTTSQDPIGKNSFAVLAGLCDAKGGDTLNKLLEAFNVSALGELTNEQYPLAVEWLKNV